MLEWLWDQLVWWWDHSVLLTGNLTIGGLILFAIGLAVALVVALWTLLKVFQVISGLTRFGGDVVAAFREGWRQDKPEHQDPADN